MQTTKYSRFLSIVLLMTLSLTVFTVTGCDGKDDPTPPANLFLFAAPGSAQEIIKKAEYIISNVKTTQYQHPTEVDEEKGVYKVDCSGLVDYILKQVARDNYDKLPITTSVRPLAEDFYHYISELSPGAGPAAGEWSRIGSMADALPGDIMAYEYNQATKDAKGTTGHVMIIASVPELQSNGDYMVWIIDSANSGHGSDTRTGDGVGRGKMWFGVDGSGTPVYYRWSKVTGDKHSDGLLGITIGRAG